MFTTFRLYSLGRLSKAFLSQTKPYEEFFIITWDII